MYFVYSNDCTVSQLSPQNGRLVFTQIYCWAGGGWRTRVLSAPSLSDSEQGVDGTAIMRMLGWLQAFPEIGQASVY
jgi:hypothetical protein